MTQWTQHLLGEPEDQSFNPQCPHEAEYGGTLFWYQCVMVRWKLSGWILPYTAWTTEEKTWYVRPSSDPHTCIHVPHTTHALLWLAILLLLFLLLWLLLFNLTHTMFNLKPGTTVGELYSSDWLVVMSVRMSCGAIYLINGWHVRAQPIVSNTISGQMGWVWQ